jgi:hypothetical protein
MSAIGDEKIHSENTEIVASNFLLQLRSLRLGDGMQRQQLLQFNEMMDERLGGGKNEILLTYVVYKISKVKEKEEDASG